MRRGEDKREWAGRGEEVRKEERGEERREEKRGEERRREEKRGEEKRRKRTGKNRGKREEHLLSNLVLLHRALATLS